MAGSGFYLSDAQSFLTTGTLLICFVVFLFMYKIIGHVNHRIPPGPVGLPLIGNLLTVAICYVNNKHPHDLMNTLANKYGKVFGLRFSGGVRLVVLNDFASVMEAFKNPRLTHRAPNEVIRDAIGANGVLNSSGEIWKHQRRFSLSVFRNFGVGKKIFDDRIITEAEYLSEEFAAFQGEPFDPKHHLLNATSNIICSIIFGNRFNYSNKEFKRILSSLDKRIQLVGSGGLIVFVPLLRCLAPGATENTIKIIQKSVEYFKAIVDDHKLRLETSDECDDFIDLYLKEIEKNKHDYKEPRDFVDERHLFALIDSLFLAGTETSSNTLGWSLLYMATLPDVQQRIQDEILSVCGERLPSYADQQNMPFTQAVILEIQRLHTVVPLGVPHYANEDTTIQGYEIHKNTIVVSNLWGVLHDPDVWSDPEVFKPERFLNEKGEIVTPKEWIPFSIGRRICLGEKLAKMEIFIFLTHLLTRFSFKKPDGQNSMCFEGRSGATYSPLPFKISAIVRSNSK